MRVPQELRCLEHSIPLVQDADSLVCESGCRVPVIGGVPRFVNSTNYAANFGLQWNQFRKTQLDSYTQTTISKDRLTRAIGGSLEILSGRSVLEVGCGAGRFTEVMLAAGARVFACDLSTAVEANYANCGEHPKLFCLPGRRTEASSGSALL
jgi:SAM-dependent methyltransferase